MRGTAHFGNFHIGRRIACALSANRPASAGQNANTFRGFEGSLRGFPEKGLGVPILNYQRDPYAHP